MLSYSNRGKPNGPVAALPKTAGGGLVMYPQAKGLFGKAETLASKLSVGPKSLEGAYKAGIGKPLFGPYWCARTQGGREEGRGGGGSKEAAGRLD